MSWIFIGTLLGSLVTSSHDTEEACRGRLAMLAKKDVVGQCIQQQQMFSYSNNAQTCNYSNSTIICK